MSKKNKKSKKNFGKYFYVVNVGNDNNPATQEDINDIQKQFKKMGKNPKYNTLITNHTVVVHRYERG